MSVPSSTKDRPQASALYVAVHRAGASALVLGVAIATVAER